MIVRWFIRRNLRQRIDNAGVQLALAIAANDERRIDRLRIVIANLKDELHFWSYRW